MTRRKNSSTHEETEVFRMLSEPLSPRVVDTISSIHTENMHTHIEGKLGLSAFKNLLQGLTFCREDFVHAHFADLKNSLFNDISFVFTSRPLQQLIKADIDHIQQDDYDEDLDYFFRLSVYGFKNYSLDYLVNFSKELVLYLETIFDKKIPFDTLVILISDKDTKIESIGNILIFNDIVMKRLERSPNALIYTSLTISLFFARIYFGSMITYNSPEEKFIVEGIRGTLALLFLLSSRTLDQALSVFSPKKVHLEKIVQVEDLEESQTTFNNVLEESDVRPQVNRRNSNLAQSGFLNESMLSHKSNELGDKQREMVEINELLNLYLIEMKYKNFEIELSMHTNPLYDADLLFNKDTLDGITYNNCLAKFKMYYVLKEFKLPTAYFIKAFRMMIKSYSNSSISSQIFKEFLDEQMTGDRNNFEVEDWFLCNFEKAGINKVHYELSQMEKRPKIKNFKLVQSDMCAQNKSNPVLRKHTTDILLLNTDLDPMYHFDMAIEDRKEESIPELSKKNMPKAVVLNASENGYYYGWFNETDVSFLLDKLDKLKSEVYRYKLFKHLLLNTLHLDFLDYAPKVIYDEENFILLEFVLKNAALLIEAVFPSKCYKDFDESVVGDAEHIKDVICQEILKRLITRGTKEKRGVRELLITYLPHFISTNMKSTRETLAVLEKHQLDSKEDMQNLLNNLLERYFVFHNVNITEKLTLLKFAFNSQVLSQYLDKEDLEYKCNEIGTRLLKANAEFIFDEFYKLNLKYNRVITSNDDYAFLMANIKQLCGERVDENLIVDIFPLSFIIQKTNSTKRLTSDLVKELEEKGMFDYSAIVKEQFEKMEKMEKVYKKSHQMILNQAETTG